MVLTNLATLFFSGDYRSTPVSYATKAWYLSDYWKGSPIELSISYKELVSFLVAAAITLALWFFLQKTDTGKSIRATAQDKDAALLMGVNVERMRVVTFGIGTALVGAAGCLFIPAYYLFPDLGGQFTTIAFVVTIIGGLGSTTGAIFGGLILAIFESFTATYVGMGWATVGPLRDLRRGADLPARRRLLADPQQEAGEVGRCSASHPSPSPRCWRSCRCCRSPPT